MPDLSLLAMLRHMFMEAANPRRAAAREVVRLLREDPALGQGLEPAAFADAERSSTAATLSLHPGDPCFTNLRGGHGWFGLLVLEGLLARRVTVEGRTWTELLGEGDLAQPWQRDREEASSVITKASWQVLAPVRLAVLDRAFVTRVAPWPSIIVSLSNRLSDRIRSLTYALAACGRVGVAERLLLTLHHYADRWGRVTPNGIVLHMPGLTHEVLAAQIGAARPSVTTALGELRAQGLVVQTGLERWRLAPHEPAALAA